MKDEWKMWKALKGNEIGLGWDPIKGTVVAPELDKELYEKYQELFLGTVATGEFVYAPSSRVLPNETQETQQINTVDHVKENINAESNFDNDLDEMMNAGFGYGGSFSQAVGKYYIVDAGYQQMKGYLAPYKGARYQLPDFQRGGRPRGLKEIFNH
ncbi:hypothetical protein GH714_005845 [Hevea brasiliensis]|uniref:Myb/SANT-like domain-containing protein n=1 Tax=Hevea brasiliensis TaxID=3981 RepID=A0A6A6LCW9_HEVBR|nr:hypothetical protein GH714_005845 [Hevea brasiliensis]